MTERRADDRIREAVRVDVSDAGGGRAREALEPEHHEASGSVHPIGDVRVRRKRIRVGHGASERQHQKPEDHGRGEEPSSHRCLLLSRGGQGSGLRQCARVGESSRFHTTRRRDTAPDTDSRENIGRLSARSPGPWRAASSPNGNRIRSRDLQTPRRTATVHPAPSRLASDILAPSHGSHPARREPGNPGTGRRVKGEST